MLKGGKILICKCKSIIRFQAVESVIKQKVNRIKDCYCDKYDRTSLHQSYYVMYSFAFAVYSLSNYKMCIVFHY